MTDMIADSASRFARMAALLAQDPANPNLLADTARAAFAENRFDDAADLLDRASAQAPLPPELQHLAGLVAMRREQWGDAAGRYAALLENGADGPPVRFNLAWSLAMEKRFDEALEALDEATSEALPQAAQLEVQLLHEKGEVDRAMERARPLLARHPDHRGLNAAVSTLAIDMEDEALAAETAARAPDHPEAMVTLATLAMVDDDTDTAARLFTAALAQSPNSPRALIGHGLSELLGGDKLAGAHELDRGAEIWGDHLGSWIAAGWAYLLAGDAASAKARFERALALDDSFAESHGSLAVIDILEGRVDEAARRTAVARRLDRESFSTALAAMLLAAGKGDKERAAKIFETALNMPMDEKGRTLAKSLAGMASRLG
ncbi:tetratricopeptide repeat protein [Sphingomonas sp.]|uniref:tetratricopeptide repeat protein n=1 Tax=Sphingomonas sp. TaxID=28214 RepID=UPI001B10261B|nr:tetratricopeptide repeat protein [Sphingomonas sp.]MBO9714812.1 tetratricopeptide repeat protein [Sphingomonas sp.]